MLLAENVFGLQTFGTLLYFELYFRTLVQRAVPGRLNRGEMNKNIVAAGPLDKTEAFGRIEPLHNTFFSH